MRMIITTVVLALAIIGSVIWTAVNHNDKTAKSAQSAETSSVKDTKSSDSSKNRLIVDVRTPEEYAADHVADAINFPLDKIQNGEYPTTDKSIEIDVYCRSGARATTAAKILSDAGYKVVNLGGIAAAKEKLSKE